LVLLLLLLNMLRYGSRSKLLCICTLEHDWSCTKYSNMSAAAPPFEPIKAARWVATRCSKHEGWLRWESLLQFWVLKICS
jgi:hypothetical protein